ncbi:hypothetical protein [Hymenobacter rubidus]|uniref:hypothetical protein n=1 Tax=Hymenobacter rubidus TaxID=1441626 RepID=UPI00191E696A|nr:hypothetical protein [Hymenobacter rubidus]
MNRTDFLAPVAAQQLMWERAALHASGAGTEVLSGITLLGTTRFLIAGAYPPAQPTSGCRPSFRSFAQLFTIGGSLQREQLGRGLSNGEFDINAALSSAGWLSGRGYQCQPGSITALQRPYVQRLTAACDTLPGWWLAPPPLRNTVTAVLAQGLRLLAVGMAVTAVSYQVLTLTCSDTSGRVRWQRTYSHTPALDYATNLVATPRGGYLLNGQSESFSRFGYDHYLIETDSGGLLRRQRLFQPLGPAFINANVYNNNSNLLALPNAGGYLLAGTADSIAGGITKNIAYVVRLDTALNVVWTYRHPPALAGTLVTSDYAYRIRLLPNGTVGVMLSDVRQAGTPTVYIAQLNVATGQRVAFYALSSNTQSAVIPLDWQWVGVGTVLLCGKSLASGVTNVQGYVARYDFRGTPLAATQPAAALATDGASLWAFPTPATGRATVQVSGLGHRAGRLELLDGLGRVVRSQPVAADGDQPVDLGGLAAGLYVACLLDASGRRLGGCKLLVAP